ncbi:hypothetical protein LUZ61_008016 [Rhynchospora tenuis]|uniref:GATA-type domain-containing protein n=1 Tax=Rhynchospora tenuis TaxID=198213 RepID=A0AAD5ZUK2_9POAL|nr:hypothetical protein LUZ61_008016 [Rhynchospora tenuis]
MLHHCGNNHGTFFSLLFPLSGSKHSTNNTQSYDNDTDNIYSSTVDCTLSLGTPSTRHAETTRTRPHGSSWQSGSCASSLSWDVISTESNGHTKQLNNKSGSTKEAEGSTRLSRRCANCDTTSTPLWRNGPRGPKSLCNACGIRYKKEERRAAAAAAVSPVLDCASGYMSGYSYQNSHQQQNWGCYASTVGKGTGFSSYGDDAWRLNIVQPQPFPVMDRGGLFQYN